MALLRSLRGRVFREEAELTAERCVGDPLGRGEAVAHLPVRRRAAVKHRVGDRMVFFEVVEDALGAFTFGFAQSGRCHSFAQAGE